MAITAFKDSPYQVDDLRPLPTLQKVNTRFPRLEIGQSFRCRKDAGIPLLEFISYLNEHENQNYVIGTERDEAHRDMPIVFRVWRIS